MEESRIKGENKGGAAAATGSKRRQGGVEGGSGVTGAGESEADGGEKVEGEAAGREEGSWISGAVLQRDTSAF